jgi:hypothetical protein
LPFPTGHGGAPTVQALHEARDPGRGVEAEQHVEMRAHDPEGERNGPFLTRDAREKPL